jgi:hypothetical protein
MDPCWHEKGELSSLTAQGVLSVLACCPSVVGADGIASTAQRRADRPPAAADSSQSQRALQ